MLWQSAKLFSLVKQSLLGTLKTFCPVESPLSACLHVCLIVLTALIEQKKKKKEKNLETFDILFSDLQMFCSGI